MSATSTAVRAPRRPASTRTTRWRPATLVLIAIVAGLGAWHGVEASQHVLTDRDPGVYVTAGRWLAREGTLLVDPAVGPFRDAPDLVFEEQGWNLDGEGRLEPQFLHLLPVVLAAAQRLGGDRLLLLAPPIVAALATLAVHAFGRRMLRPWWALTATAAFAISLPWVHMSRDAFSEPLAVLLLFAGLTVLWDATTTGSGWRAWAAGLLLGAVAMTRVEGFVALLPLVGWAVVTARSARRRGPAARRTSARLVGGLLVGLVTTTGLAVADLVLFSSWYLDDLGGLLRAVAGALVVLLVAGAVLVASSPLAAGRERDEVPARRRDGLGWVSALAVVAVAGAGWVVRPLVSTVTGAPSDAIAVIEEREGLVAEGVRRYSEHSVQWLGWYLGPVALLLGFVGLALVARRLVADPDGDRRLLPFVGVLTVISVLYLWRPSIVPDHVWAMRRYAIVTIPGLLLLAGLTGQVLVDRARTLGRAPLAVVTGAAVAGAVIAFPVSTLVPVAGATTQAGALDAIGDVCAATGSDAAVVVLPGDSLELVLAQTIRSFCGVPVAIAEPSLTAGDVRLLAEAWAGERRDLHVVGADAEEVGSFAGRPAELVRLLANDEQLEATLTRRPDRLSSVPIRLVVADASPSSR